MSTSTETIEALAKGSSRTASRTSRSASAFRALLSTRAALLPTGGTARAGPLYTAAPHATAAHFTKGTNFRGKAYPA